MILMNQKPPSKENSDMPNMLFQNQSPASRGNDNKRPCTVLSPLDEELEQQSEL